MISIKTIIKLVLIGAIVGTIIYFRIKKIPIWCLACEETGTWTRCIEGTGKGTTTCDSYNAVQGTLSNVKGAYGAVVTEVKKFMAYFQVPMDAIKSAIKSLEEIFSQIKFIPKIEPINIPKIPSFKINLDLSSIPTIDPCKEVIKPAVDNIVYGINQTIDPIQTATNKIIDGLNQTIEPIKTTISRFDSTIGGVVSAANYAIDKANEARLGIPKIPYNGIGTVNINSISKVDIGKIKADIPNCDIKLKESISVALDGIGQVGTMISNGINDTIIPALNDIFDKIKSGINTAIDAINTGIKMTIDAIKSSISNTISFLKDQLQSLNIFAGVMGGITNLISNIKTINPLQIANSYILPAIQALIPGAKIGDALLLLIIMFAIPFIMPILTMLFIVIDVLPIP